MYLIGAQGVRDELDEVGIEYFGFGPEPEDRSDGSAFMFDIELECKVRWQSIKKFRDRILGRIEEGRSELHEIR